MAYSPWPISPQSPPLFGGLHSLTSTSQTELFEALHGSAHSGRVSCGLRPRQQGQLKSATTGRAGGIRKAPSKGPQDNTSSKPCRFAPAELVVSEGNEFSPGGSISGRSLTEDRLPRRPWVRANDSIIRSIQSALADPLAPVTFYPRVNCGDRAARRRSSGKHSCTSIDLKMNPRGIRCVSPWLGRAMSDW
jgi:hypothetical protein